MSARNCGKCGSIMDDKPYVVCSCGARRYATAAELNEERKQKRRDEARRIAEEIVEEYLDRQRQATHKPLAVLRDAIAAAILRGVS